MARYYFDIRHGQDLYPDEEGLELADQRAAKIEAARALGDLTEDLSPLDEGRHLAIEVRTLNGPMFYATFVSQVAQLKQ